MTAALNTVIIVVAHTPLWVWPLYALLLLLGLQRTRDSIVPFWRFLILPVVVIFFSVLGILAAGLSTLPAMAVGLAVGGTTGWWLEPSGSARRMAGGRLWLRGEWWTLVQIGLVAIFRYVTNAMSAMDPILRANLEWHASVILISSVLSGLFLGRTAARLGMYAANPHRA